MAWGIVSHAGCWGKRRRRSGSNCRGSARRLRHCLPDRRSGEEEEGRERKEEAMPGSPCPQ
eukprot:6166401-Pyramimonas_sp.AAC.1